MAWCPHCDHFYDEDNETQPCCGGCGHPLTCACDGHRDTPTYEGSIAGEWHWTLWDCNGLLDPDFPADYTPPDVPPPSLDPDDLPF